MALQLDDKYLHKKCVPYIFTKESKEYLKKLKKDMLTVMRRHSGVGIAANQVGLNTRIFMIKNTMYINPIIHSFFGGYRESAQGCLSVIGTYKVTWPSGINIEYTNMKGKQVIASLSDEHAEIFHHEFGHINGITIKDHGLKLIGTAPVITTWEGDSSDQE